MPVRVTLSFALISVLNGTVSLLTFVLIDFGIVDTSLFKMESPLQ